MPPKLSGNPRPGALSIAVLVFLYTLMFWVDLKAFRPGMDSMTYGAIARHMVTSGNWATPHYTDQAYIEFFQHPPLGLWLVAGCMKLFGAVFGPAVMTADWILKVMSSLMAGACALGVYLFGRRIRGENFAFLATLVLLTSTRFAKYSRGLMLDPFLAAFSLWALYFACVSRDSGKSRLYVFASGLFVAAAFLSKGLFAFAPLSVIFLLYGADVKTRGWRPLVLFLLGLILPFALWFLFGGAAHYLSLYYSMHVADRIGPHPLRDHLLPIENLAKMYWPWFPFFLWGIWKSAKRVRNKNHRDESAILLTALAFIGGFVLVASFLEQYHVATYPFAALVTAMGVPEAWERFRVPIQRGLLVVCLGFLVFCLSHPYSMQGTEYKNPIRNTLKEVHQNCTDPKIHRITISTGVAEEWYALAIGSWYTTWDARSGSPTQAPGETGSGILLASNTDSAGKGWEATGIGDQWVRVYRATGVAECRPPGAL